MPSKDMEKRRKITRLSNRLRTVRRLRRQMHALMLRHQALRDAAQCYVDEWRDDLPKGWSLDELLQALQLEHEIPDDSRWVFNIGKNIGLQEDLPRDRDELQRLLNAAYRKGNNDTRQAARFFDVHAFAFMEGHDAYREAFVQVRTALMLLMGPDDESSLAARLEMNRKAGLSEHGLEILDQNSKLLLSLKPLAKKAHAELGTSPDTVSAFPEDPACPTPA